MKTFKGTQGKWKINKSENIIDSSGYGIAQPHGINNDDKWIYNAKLIAAAPELLDALQKVALDLKLLGLPEHSPMRKNVEQAINKAI